MLVFLLSNLPLPIVLYLNWRVTTRYLKVRQLSRHVAIEKPRRLTVGWWLSNLSIIFVLIPILSERAIFIQDTRWLFSFAVAAGMTITGLALMNSALGEELHELERVGGVKNLPKAVDTE
jgi:hypothetical protein